MRSHSLFALAVVSLFACGGDSPVNLDGGGDATSSDGASNGDAANDGSPLGDGGGTDGNVSDGGGSDASPADGGTPFACGNKTCDAKTDYCQVAKPGPDGGLPDAGPKVDGGLEVDTCVAYPAACTADGGTPSCACIPSTCGCTQNGSEITVTCP